MNFIYIIFFEYSDRASQQASIACQEMERHNHSLDELSTSIEQFFSYMVEHDMKDQELKEKILHSLQRIGGGEEEHYSSEEGI